MKKAANGDKIFLKEHSGVNIMQVKTSEAILEEVQYILESFHQSWSTSCRLCSFDVHNNQMLNVLYPPFQTFWGGGKAKKKNNILIKITVLLQRE